MKRQINILLIVCAVLLIGMNSCEKKQDNVVVGSISGTIINSQTGDGLANVTISLTQDESATSGVNASIKETTDASGYFNIENVPVGTYFCIIEADDYITRIVDNVEIIEGVNELYTQTIVATPEIGSLRIILNWGENPFDLDSHLTGPASDNVSRFHMYFSYKTPDINVDLDVDDTYSYGPETTTIHAFMNGTYRFSVHNYSDQSETGGAGIASSPARVEIYTDAGLVGTYNAPIFTGSGNTWRVFEIEVSGTQVTIVPVNEYVQATYYIADDFKGTEKKINIIENKF
jgi:hypothetical protein